jgi:hypothetical protein
MWLASTLIPIAVASLLACSGSPADFPAGDPPGDDDISAQSGDAGPPADGGYQDGGALGPLTGKICMMDDLQIPTSCVIQARPGIQVARAGQANTTVLTDASGTFSMPGQSDDTQVLLTITDPSLIFAPGATVYDTTQGSQNLEVIDATTLSDVEIASNIGAVAGTGNVFVYLRRDGVVVDDATLGNLSLAPATYDQGDGFTFATLPPTGQTGLAVYFNAAPDIVAPFPHASITEGGLPLDDELVVPVVGNANTVVFLQLAPL